MNQAQERVIRTIKRIQFIPNARVDRNYLQGRDAVLEQFRRIPGKMEQVTVDHFIAEAQQKTAQLANLVLPYKLPNDYRFFLEYCGGLRIVTKAGSPLLDIFGIGPAVEAWYGDIVEYHLDLSATIEQLYIAMWNGRFHLNEQTQDTLGIISRSGDSSLKESLNPPYRWVKFFLDLVGTVQKYSILVLESEDNRKGQLRWRKIADSFTEWLELTAATEGTFGYVGLSDGADVGSVF